MKIKNNKKDDKDENGKVTQKRLFDVRYVPLVSTENK